MSSPTKVSDLVRVLGLHKSEEKHLELIAEIVRLDLMDVETGRQRDSEVRHQRAAKLRQLRQLLPENRVNAICDKIEKLHRD